jgi:hypothetical protein
MSNYKWEIQTYDTIFFSCVMHDAAFLSIMSRFLMDT